RERLVDALLERPEFVDYWAYKWSDVLLVSCRKLSRKSAQAFYDWIREGVAANKRWDAFARELTTASGRSDEQGAVNYFLIHRSAIDLAESYTQAFLGLTLTCARCLTAADNTLFARAVVNRVWGNFLGRGLVNPVDDLRSTNPASNDELFAAVARDFVAHGYDVKRLIRTIMTSATYQRSSQTSALNIDDDRYYSHYLIRRLPAEVILDAFSQVTGVPEKFEGYPLGTRALQLPDTRVKS